MVARKNAIYVSSAPLHFSSTHLNCRNVTSRILRYKRISMAYIALICLRINSSKKLHYLLLFYTFLRRSTHDEWMLLLREISGLHFKQCFIYYSVYVQTCFYLHNQRRYTIGDYLSINFHTRTNRSDSKKKKKKKLKKYMYSKSRNRWILDIEFSVGI